MSKSVLALSILLFNNIITIFKLNPVSENVIAKFQMDNDNELPIGRRTWTFVMAEGDGRLFL